MPERKWQPIDRSLAEAMDGTRKVFAIYRREAAKASASFEGFGAALTSARDFDVVSAEAEFYWPDFAYFRRRPYDHERDDR